VIEMGGSSTVVTPLLIAFGLHGTVLMTSIR